MTTIRSIQAYFDGGGKCVQVEFRKYVDNVLQIYNIKGELTAVSESDITVDITKFLNGNNFSANGPEPINEYDIINYHSCDKGAN
ncbi:MAG: hypothetical protein U9Q92_04710 [archaeon]|nr:hypothetical protein [archaeon]